MTATSSIPEVDTPTSPMRPEIKAVRDAAAPRRGLPRKKSKVPDAAICEYWFQQVKAGEEKAAANKAEAKEAEAFYRGKPEAWTNKELWDGPVTQENAFYRDVHVLSGQLMYTDPKVLISTNRGEMLMAFADSLSTLVNYTIKEQSYRNEIKRALIQAIFRNVSWVYHAWDPQRGLPCIQWCANEVWPDVDCHGDTKRAAHMIEEVYLGLDEILSDPEIDEKIKNEILDAREALRFPDGQEEHFEGKIKRSQASLIKVRAFRVWSKKGEAPHRRHAPGLTNEDLESSVIEGKSEMTASPDAVGMPVTPNPATTQFTAADRAAAAEGRTLLLLIDNFKKVVKQEPWPIDCLDRDDFPYSMLRLTELPGDLYGVSLFSVLKPLFKIINFILSFWFADARTSCQRINLYDKAAIPEDAERKKLHSGEHNIWLGVEKGRVNDALGQKEFTPRSDGVLQRLLEIAKRGHDDVSGVTDMQRGAAGDVEKTKAEAQILNDRASEAIGLLVDAVDEFLRDVCRKTTMIVQRYVLKESLWEDCPTCQGTGAVDATDLEAMGVSGVDLKICEECGGSGHQPDPIRKGADFFLDEYKAANYRDDFTTDQIRAELAVDVEPGSTRRSNQERRQQQLIMLFNTVGPHLEKYGLFKQFFELIKRIILTSELPDAESMVPKPEDWQPAVEAAMAAQQAAAAPPPDPAIAEQEKAAAEAEAAEAQRAFDAEEKEKDRQHELTKLQADPKNAVVEVEAETKRTEANIKAQVLEEDLRAKRLENDAKLGLLQTQASKETAMVEAIAGLQTVVQATAGMMVQLGTIVTELAQRFGATGAAERDRGATSMDAMAASLANLANQTKANADAVKELATAERVIDLEYQGSKVVRAKSKVTTAPRWNEEERS